MVDKAKMLSDYMKDWFTFLKQDEFQAFLIIVVLIVVFKLTGFITIEFFEKVFLFGMGFAFGDNAFSTIAKSFIKG